MPAYSTAKNRLPKNYYYLFYNLIVAGQIGVPGGYGKHSKEGRVNAVYHVTKRPTGIQLSLSIICLQVSPMKKIFTALILFSSMAMAEVEENHCLNPESARNNEQMARNNPNDPILIKLVALRAGLCDLVDKGIVDLEFAIGLFDFEKSKGVMKRLEEDVKNNIEHGA